MYLILAYISYKFNKKAYKNAVSILCKITQWGTKPCEIIQTNNRDMKRWYAAQKGHSWYASKERYRWHNHGKAL